MFTTKFNVGELVYQKGQKNGIYGYITAVTGPDFDASGSPSMNYKYLSTRAGCLKGTSVQGSCQSLKRSASEDSMIFEKKDEMYSDEHESTRDSESEAEIQDIPFSAPDDTVKDPDYISAPEIVERETEREPESGSSSSEDEEDEEEQPAEGQYWVEKIVGKMVEKGITYYNVKWFGCPSSDNTWQERESFAGSGTIDDFEAEERFRNPVEPFRKQKSRVRMALPKIIRKKEVVPKATVKKSKIQPVVERENGLMSQELTKSWTETMFQSTYNKRILSAAVYAVYENMLIHKNYSSPASPGTVLGYAFQNLFGVEKGEKFGFGNAYNGTGTYGGKSKRFHFGVDFTAFGKKKLEKTGFPYGDVALDYHRKVDEDSDYSD